MGRGSSKENKNIYQLSREKNGLTRAAASELMSWISDSRIEKIESEKSKPSPDEVIEMARAYKKPELCNYYCSHECPIGIKYVPEVQEKPLSEIVLSTISILNNLQKEKDRLIEIASDGIIHDDEIEDFVTINDQLESISVLVDSLKLWFDNTISEGKINTEILNETIKNKNNK